MPDHEPALGQDLATARTGWISGHGLARGASLLIHDCQYAESEYPAHRGWGHSSLPDALAFARRSDAQRLVLVHHDPWHNDSFLEALGQEASDRWADRGGNLGCSWGARGTCSIWPPHSIGLSHEQPVLQDVGDRTSWNGAGSSWSVIRIDVRARHSKTQRREAETQQRPAHAAERAAS